jgi:hypothetical protein
VTRLDRLDGPATTAVSEQLVDVYRAAMGAAPFHETEVPSEGWYGLLRDAVGQGPDGAGRWLEGQFAVVWIAVRPNGAAGASAGGCWNGCWRRSPTIGRG